MSNPKVVRILFVLLSIGASLLVTSVLVMVVGQSPLDVLDRIWQGAFRNSESTAGVFNFWIPLALCSMGLILTFTAGLWNIGAEGQVLAGAIAASWAARTFVLPNEIQIPLELLFAVAGGALWGLLIGILKTRFGVNEIFGGVGLNAIISVYSIYLIAGPWQPPEGGSAQSTQPFPDHALLHPMNETFPVSLIALILTAVAIVAVYLLLRGTRWGLQLKATGKNAKSALLLGVPTTRATLTALMAGGVLAGLAGAYRVLFTYDSLRPNVSGGIGYLGLLLVLLTGMSAIWTPIVAFIFAAILSGSTRLRVSLGLDSSLAGVLQGILVLSMLLFNGVRQRWEERRKSKTVTPSAVESQPTPSNAKAASGE
ncbi:MAG: inner-membrane translocator [Chloroflexi bacterium OLB15]|nr:MAG: inner-membrane translocator [Chloroflexi bacterium OLB15]